MSSSDPFRHDELLNDTNLSDVKDRLSDTTSKMKEKVGQMADTASKTSISSARTPPILSDVRRRLCMRMRTSFLAAPKSRILHTMWRTASNRRLPTFDDTTCPAWVRM